MQYLRLLPDDLLILISKYNVTRVDRYTIHVYNFPRICAAMAKSKSSKLLICWIQCQHIIDYNCGYDYWHRITIFSDMIFDMTCNICQNGNCEMNIEYTSNDFNHKRHIEYFNNKIEFSSENEIQATPNHICKIETKFVCRKNE